jgi:photosystem II stability/assembly factor-like uncharacterized protein
MTRLGFFALILVTAAPVAAQQPPAGAPPLTKEQEREKFHPRTEGMDAARRLEGFSQRLEMERVSPLATLQFRNVGPEIQGGRIVDIEAPLASPDSLLVAFASGGLWRTDNRGGSWTPLFDDQSSMTIGDIALGDAEAKVIYVGTGENNSSRTSYSGTGIFKTTDGGLSWRHLGLVDSHRIGRVLVDPRDPQVVYVAASGHLYTENVERGVFKTRDGGESWTRVLFVDERTGAIDLVQDPQRPDTLYAAMWERARTAANFLESGPGSGIWKSLDAGETWTRLGGGFPQGATVGRIGLALAASQPDTVYAVLDNQALRPDSEPFDEETPPGELTTRRLRKLDAEQFARLPKPVIARFLENHEFPKKLKPAALKRDVKAGKITLDDLLAYVKDANRDLFENPVIGPEVYRSDDGGASWKRTHEGRIEKVFFSYGYYFARIAVDPRDPERVYFGGVPLLGSADGGRTWTGLDQRGVHADHHALHIDPRHPHRLALGNDGGLNLSFDYGQTWTKVNNLPVGQFTTLALDDARPYNILGGLQDNGVLRGPSTYERGRDDPAAWKTILGGDGSAVVVDPEDRDVAYAAFQFGHTFRLDLKSGSRTRIRPRPELSAEKKEKPLRYNWVTPFVLSPHSNNILYFGANRLYRSFDRGETWTAISGDLTSDAEQGDVPFGTITSVSESPKTFGVIYVGTDEGKVWGTRDGGVTWKDLSQGLARDRWVTRVVASAFDEGTVYVSQNGYRNDDFAAYVFRSADFGEEWESLAGGLPAEPVNTVREDPEARHALYVGTDHGAFASLDRGETWIPLTGGLPRVPVHDLLVHPREGDLVLATHGRSVFVADAAPLRKLTESVMEEPLHAFSIKKAQGDPGRGYGEHPYVSWRQKRPVVRIAYWLATGTATEITIKDEHGSPWTRLEGTASEGLNVIEYDLSADPDLATAAEAVARSKALEELEKTKSAKPADPEPAVEDEDEDTEEAEVSAPPLDDELHGLLADPLRDSRARYLPPGKYTVEIRAGKLKKTTRLTVEPPKE